MSPKSVYLGGSRNLKHSRVIPQFVAKVFAQGAVISVGCATGADELVVNAAVAQGQAKRLTIHAIFSQGGWGAISCSAVNSVKAASQKGAQVNWFLNPDLPLKQRLIARSVAGLKGACCAVFFAPGSGSFKVAIQAIRKNIPVYIFQETQPIMGLPSNWVQVQLHGFTCWQYRRETFTGAISTKGKRN